MRRRHFILGETVRLIRRHPLSRGKVFSRILRYFRWQLSTRIWPGSRLVELTSLTNLIVQRGMHGATGNVFLGLHEVADMGFALHFLRPEDHFVDVGANVGVYTVLAAGHVKCRATTIEPAPNTFEHLRDNILINDLSDRVLLVQCGVGDETCSARMTTDSDAKNHILNDESTATGSNTAEIEIRTLDDICKDEVPRLIKIDVEGFETKVISGGQETFTKESLKAILIELNGFGERYGFDEAEVAKTLMEWGFAPVVYDPLTRSIKKVGGVDFSLNSLFVRDLDWIQRRVREAPVVSGWWGQI